MHYYRCYQFLRLYSVCVKILTVENRNTAENKNTCTQGDTFCQYASGRSTRATPALALRERPVIGYKTPNCYCEPWPTSRRQKASRKKPGRRREEDDITNLENVRTLLACSLSYGHKVSKFVNTVIPRLTSDPAN